MSFFDNRDSKHKIYDPISYDNSVSTINPGMPVGSSVIPYSTRAGQERSKLTPTHAAHISLAWGVVIWLPRGRVTLRHLSVAMTTRAHVEQIETKYKTNL